MTYIPTPRAAVRPGSCSGKVGASDYEDAEVAQIGSEEDNGRRPVNPQTWDEGRSRLPFARKKFTSPAFPGIHPTIRRHLGLAEGRSEVRNRKGTELVTRAAAS